MKLLFIVLLLSSYLQFYPQSDLDRILKGGEIIVNGLTLLKKDKSKEVKEDTKVIETICIQNKMEVKITFTMIGHDESGTEITKELVVQKGGKECVFEIPKGIYSYKIVLANNEIFKKGEYKFEDELTIIVRQEGG